MDALAQEATEAIPGPQVWEVVQQWPILLLFLAGVGFAYWVWGRKKDEPDPSPTGGDDLRAFIGAKFDGIGSQIASVKEDVSELKADFKAHALQDRESFRELYDRTSPREAWSDKERAERTPRAAGQWKAGREPR